MCYFVCYLTVTLGVILRVILGLRGIVEEDLLSVDCEIAWEGDERWSCDNGVCNKSSKVKATCKHANGQSLVIAAREVIHPVVYYWKLELLQKGM